VNGNKIDIQMNIKPEAQDGLIFWTGKSYPLTSSSDFLALGFRARALELRYNLGSGDAVIMVGIKHQSINQCTYLLKLALNTSQLTNAPIC
jgi:hypothetical protein